MKGHILAERRDDERDTLGHQARNEVNIAAQAVEFRDNDRRFDLLRLAECRGDLRTLFQRVRAFSGLDLYKLTSGFQSFAGGKPCDGIPRRFKAEAAFALLIRRTFKPSNDPRPKNIAKGDIRDLLTGFIAAIERLSPATDSPSEWPWRESSSLARRSRAASRIYADEPPRCGRWMRLLIMLPAVTWGTTTHLSM
jgi:hypothetical protein